MANDGKPVEGSVYFYAPTKIAPVIFAIGFLISGLLHLWQCIHYKAFRIMWMHLLCCLLFTIGFALREYGSFDYKHLDVYIASTILIYCAPPILELANYHILGRVLYYVPYFAPLHPGRTLTTFGTLSTVVEVLNAIGISYLANSRVPEKFQKTGHVMMKASLILQLGVIAFFCVIVAIFHRRCYRARIRGRGVTGPLLTLYASQGLILMRTIYRTVEHFSIATIPRNPGPNWDPMSLSLVVRYEWFFYVFEASLMLLNTLLWNASHPRRYLPEDYHVYLAQDGKTELEGPGWKDDQPWIMTWVDPCGMTVAIRRKVGKKGGVGEEKPFWETNGYEMLPRNGV